jgi:hypothetical protein
MGKWKKLREKFLVGDADANIAFDVLCHLLRRFGFRERVSGSHHIFSQEDGQGLSGCSGARLDFEI